jgi:putative ABC transport system permease protein
MIKNYILTAFRSLLRNRTYAILNILGLALGIGCVLVIYKVIDYEMSFDVYRPKFENTYRLVREDIISTGINYNVGVPHPIGDAFRLDFPNIKSGLVHYMYGGMLSTTIGEDVVRYQEEDGIAFAENELLEILDFEIIIGDKVTPLLAPGSAIVSESIVLKYFELNANQLDRAIGKTMQLENKVDFKIAAIMKDHSEKTDFPFDVLIEYSAQSEINPYYSKGTNWHSNSGSTNCMLLIPDQVSIDDLESQFPALINKYYGDNASDIEKYFVQPLAEIHSDPNYENYTGRQITSEILLSFALIGFFILITASINFVNLSTAQAVNRSKEVGIRKTLGGIKSQLISQFMCETILITAFSAFIGLMIAEVMFIYLEEIIGYALHLNLISEPMTMFFLLIVIVVVGLVAGTYPSWIMSNMNPVLAMKNNFNGIKGKGFLSLRRILVVLQFSISQILIIGTIVVSTQMDFFLNKDLGFEKDAIINLELPTNEELSLNRLKTELLNHKDIEQVSFCMSSPLGNSNSFSNIMHKSLNKDDEYRANFKIIDDDYIDVFDLKLLAGRDFYSADSTNVVIIGRKVVELIGYMNPEDAIGDHIEAWNGPMKIVGVVEDFHTRSLSESIDYIIMIKEKKFYFSAQLRINTINKSFADIQDQLKYIESKWISVYPNNIFDYKFYSDKIADRYDKEKQMSELFQLFSVIAIFIGCLGLYGLIAFVSNQKTKEIGIRKVLGASIWNVLKIFSKEIVILIIFSFAIAGPFGFYIMSIWLDNYVYSISLSPQIFLIALAISLVIALITIGYKSISASLANPVNSLKDE